MLANGIKMVIEVNHVNMLKKHIVIGSNPFLMLLAGRQEFGGGCPVEHGYFRIEFLCHKPIYVAS